MMKITEKEIRNFGKNRTLKNGYQTLVGRTNLINNLMNLVSSENPSASSRECWGVVKDTITSLDDMEYH